MLNQDDAELVLQQPNLADPVGLARLYVAAALFADEKPGKSGACHLFRHTAATLMLEGSANIRFIQQMLGHNRLDTTQIYTHVSIRMLKQIHAAAQPAARHNNDRPLPVPGNPNAEELLAALAAEDGEED